jgi:hypothetical protein
MSLAERGLLATLRWYVWANDTLPRDPTQLARVLGLEEPAAREALTDRVLKFFSPCVDNEDRLHCPELSAQMEKLRKRRADLAEFGSKGGAKSLGRKRKRSVRTVTQAPAQANAQAEATPVLKLTEKSRIEKTRTELCKEANVTNHESTNAAASQHDAWISDYSTEEKAERYRRASRGN